MINIGILYSEDWQEYSTCSARKPKYAHKSTYIQPCMHICAQKSTYIQTAMHIACMHICAQKHIYTDMLAQMHNCTHLCRHAHINAHSGTKNVHAWLISVNNVSSMSGASEGPPHVVNSDFGKLKLALLLLLLLLLFVSDITSHRSDFIIVSFRLVETLLSWSWFVCSSGDWLLMPRSTGPKES